MKYYEVRDPVYGFISFNEFEKELINHTAFQRLRRIKQLALTEMAYPSATHTRFEHSLGVMHLASKFYEKIISVDENREYLTQKLYYNEVGLEREKQVIRLAALLHDIGHTPFSHVGEGKRLMEEKPETQKPYKHEDYSSEIIKRQLKETIEENELNKQNYNISADEVAGLIEGDPNLGPKIFWKQLISGQLDADRCDYLLRDSHHAGVKYGIFDVSRLIATITIGEHPETEEPIIAVDKSGWHVAESLLLSRYYMFTQVYFHKTRRAYDYHLSRALESILQGGKFPAPEKITQFVDLDDWTIAKDILKSDNDDCKRIQERRHIRCIYETSEAPGEKEDKEFEKVKELLGDLIVCEDIAEKKWYELNSEGIDMEIYIKEEYERKIKPLSEISIILPKMEKMKQKRLYIKPEFKGEAKSKLKERGLNVR